MSARVTPATRAAQAAGVAFSLHAYVHDPAAGSYAMEAAAALGIDPERVLKTLVVTSGDALVIAILAAAATLDLRAVGKRAALAPTQRAERVTGYVAGGISPLGQRRRLPAFLDEAALQFPSVLVSAGRRGLELELAPTDLVALTGAEIRRLRRATP